MKATQNNKQQDYSTTFNLDQLNRIASGDKKFVIQMTQEFMSITSECSEIMKTAIMNNDWAKLKTIAHKNIPSYSIMGLNDLVGILKEIEHNAQIEEKQEEIKEYVELICEMNSLVIISLQEHLKLTPD